MFALYQYYYIELLFLILYCNIMLCAVLMFYVKVSYISRQYIWNCTNYPQLNINFSQHNILVCVMRPWNCKYLISVEVGHLLVRWIWMGVNFASAKLSSPPDKARQGCQPDRWNIREIAHEIYIFLYLPQNWGENKKLELTSSNFQ